MTQLLLHLSTPPVFRFDNLVLHEGISDAVGTVRSVYRKGERPYPSLFLFGPSGTGKTHLLHALASLLEGVPHPGSRARFINHTDHPGEPSGMERLLLLDETEMMDVCAVLVDDVHLMATEDEPNLWSLANRLTRSGAALIMASERPPEDLFPDNDHLRSRILSGLVLGLTPPDDVARLLILDKMARDRNLRLSQDVAHYLVTRKARNVKELGALFDKLDTASLLLKRRITLPLVRTLEKEGAL